MSEKTDITISLPMEHFDALSAVMSAGLRHAKIKLDERKELEAWWAVESDLIQSEVELSDKNIE
jgi:hypothetical protein